MSEKKSIKYYIHIAIMILIMFGFGKLPAFGPVTPLGMNIIGVFLGLLYGWSCVDLICPSMVGILSLILVCGMKPKMV